jgi:hypothetical protein
MVDLYRRNGGAPEPLPARAFTADGLSRTNLTNEPETCAALGFVLFGSYDPATQAVVRRGDGYAIVPLAQKDDPDPVTVAQRIDAERDRRIQLPFEFEGHLFQSDDLSRARIDKSRGSALAAAIGGAQPGDLRWTGLPVDFFWIALDNTRVAMDAPTMIRLGNASAANEGLQIVAANDLKKRIEAGEAIADIGADALWP